MRTSSQENIAPKQGPAKGPSASQINNLINYQHQKQHLLKQQRDAIEEHLMKEMEGVTFHP